MPDAGVRHVEEPVTGSRGLGTPWWRGISRERRAALEELIAAYHPQARALARLLSRDAHAAEDLLQDALVQALRRPPDSLTEEAFRAWLRTVMARLAIRRWRRGLREIAVLAHLRERPPDAAALSGLSERLLIALAELSPRQRACVVLRYLEDLREADVAEALGLRLGTVKSHLAQARERLRASLAISTTPVADAANPNPRPADSQSEEGS